MGVPGSGKSTHAKANAQGVLLSADAIRNAGADAEAHMERLRRRTYALLSGGKDVTVDACNVHAAPRRALLTIAARTQARTRLVVIDSTLEQAMRGQRGRAHPVPRADVVKYMRQWGTARDETKREAWGEVVIVPRRG